MSSEPNSSHPSSSSLWKAALKGAFQGACLFLVIFVCVCVLVWAIIAFMVGGEVPFRLPTIGFASIVFATGCIVGGAVRAVLKEKKNRSTQQ